ncbi:MAG: SDR family oxidoreductase [Proteobacteria bacterium]|nr:SDR family oxidoreductase [Pseudomonadota bacterium]NDC24642.1 SDR family oxidoreductase [Pseudomonadota bacterium]NDD04674.1 SDR family oxidoreductase [Pseudomonadota bacterium]NDG25949.1 SDR family oxidoreductase [Pseudomonadota bacterium]
MQITQKHILVVGGSKRIGLELTRRFLKEGSFVSCLYRTLSPELESLKQQYSENLICIPFDLSSLISLSQAANQVSAWKPSIDALIMVASSFYRTPLSEVTESQWDELFDTNVKGHFFLIQQLLPTLAPQSGVITLVDMFAVKPLRGYSAYTSAKGAFLTLTRNLAKELAPKTRVNSISPGAVLLPEDFSPEESAHHATRNLLGRLGSPEDIVNATLFLLENDYVTGLNLHVDGGASLL